MAVILSVEPIKHLESGTSSVMKSVKGLLTWNTLLCEHLGKSSDRLLEVRVATPNESQSWAGKLLYSADKYSLNKDFECIKDRDVIADLRLLAQSGPKVAEACYGKTNVPNAEGLLPLKRRSVLDIVQEGLPKLTKKNWTTWYPIIEISITPCYLALDILTGKVKDGDEIYNKEIGMELFVFLHRLVAPPLRNKMDEVKKKEGLKGSAAYQAIYHECHLSVSQKAQILLQSMKSIYCKACVFFVSLFIYRGILQLMMEKKY